MMNLMMMPEFVYLNKLYYSPLDFAMSKIGGPWKMPILWQLDKVKLDFLTLKSLIPQISEEKLHAQLSELINDDFIELSKDSFDRDESYFQITEKGKLVKPIIDSIGKFGLMLMENEGIDTDQFKNMELQ